jgi:dihydrolipoamide dehydrogenase
METYDLIVIGGGPAGMEAARRAAEGKKSVLLIEQERIGGTCLNRGCIPTKALLRSGHLIATAREGEHLGLNGSPGGYDLNAVFAHARRISGTIAGQGEEALRRAGVAIVHAAAQIHDDLAVEAGGQIYHGENILAAVGGAPALPPIAGISQPGIWTSDDLFADTVFEPFESITIIGGGVIGMEFAQFFLDLGIRVTILEALPRLLANLDKDFGQSLQASFRRRGAVILTGAAVKRVETLPQGFKAVAEDKNGVQEVVSDRLLVCTGRRPATAGLFAPRLAEQLGLQRDYVPVMDDTMETAVGHLYAAGDIVMGGVQLAHAASAEAVNAVAAMFGQGGHKDLSLVPSCVYTAPECASVGLTQAQAEEKGIPVTVRRRLSLSNGKSLIDEDGRGFAKEVFDQQSGRLLGVQLMCGHASEMIGLLGLAIRQKATMDQLDETIFPHPTVSEFL